jgi:hypothetical protein
MIKSAHISQKPKAKARSNLGLTLTAIALTMGVAGWISGRVTGKSAVVGACGSACDSSAVEQRPTPEAGSGGCPESGSGKLLLGYETHRVPLTSRVKGSCSFSSRCRRRMVHRRVAPESNAAQTGHVEYWDAEPAVRCRMEYQQHPQAFPRIASLPSQTMSGVMANAATGSAQAMCQIAFTASPTRAIRER